MEIKGSEYYRIMAPRITVLVSTIDSQGKDNAAPFSFCTPVSIDPPLVAIASAPKRHTLANIRETGEFVLNIPPEDTLDALWVCAKHLDKGVSEIDEAGLTKVSSIEVETPRIGECLAWFECRLEWEKEAGDHVLVVGRIVRADVRDEFMKEERLDHALARPLLHISSKNFMVAEKNIKVES